MRTITLTKTEIRLMTKLDDYINSDDLKRAGIRLTSWTKIMAKVHGKEG